MIIVVKVADVAVDDDIMVMVNPRFAARDDFTLEVVPLEEPR